MADISAELAAIESAVYGEEVRDAIHDGLEKMNSDLNTAIGHQLLTLDDSLTRSGQGADANATGMAIDYLVKMADVLQNHTTVPITFEQGMLSSTDGGPREATNRIRSQYKTFPENGTLIVKVPSGYKSRCYLYSSMSVSGYVNLYNDWTKRDYAVVTDKAYYRLVYAKSDDSDVTPSDVQSDLVYIPKYTVDSMNQEGKAADSKAVGELFTHTYNELDSSVYNRFDKIDYNVSWSGVHISPESGGESSSSTHIATQYLQIYTDLPIAISAPSDIECIAYEYNTQSISEFVGASIGYLPGNHRRAINSRYIRIDAKYTSGSNISTTAGSSITISYYVNSEKQTLDIVETDLEKLLDRVDVETEWSQGTVSTVNGSPSSSTTKIRTEYMKVPADTTVRFKFASNMVLTVLEYSSQSVAGYIKALTFNNSTGSFSFHESTVVYVRVVVGYADETDITPSAGENVNIFRYVAKKDLSILTIGNSFSMDSFAYLPPILNELLEDYRINYGVAYSSSASISDHINMYRNSTKYTLYWEWTYESSSWKHYTSTGAADNGKTLTDILERHAWDIIYVQPASGISTASIKANVITPGRTFLRILQAEMSKPFMYLMGEWMGTDAGGDRGQSSFLQIAEGMELTARSLGIDGYIPIGAAIQDARTNEYLQVLGSGGNLLYSDGIHMQSGIPALLAAYTIALFISNGISGRNKGIKSCSFIPTTENCIAINAYHTSGVTPMTHGESVGVTEANVRAAQEIASLAIRYPTEILDCSQVVV